MTANINARPAPFTRSGYKTLGLAALGGALEIYDFIIFVFFALTLSQLFFPPEMPEWLRLLQSFGIFVTGYLARPLGGILMAHFADRLGRKKVFSLSICPRFPAGGADLRLPDRRLDGDFSGSGVHLGANPRLRLALPVSAGRCVWRDRCLAAPLAQRNPGVHGDAGPARGRCRAAAAHGGFPSPTTLPTPPGRVSHRCC